MANEDSSRSTSSSPDKYNIRTQHQERTELVFLHHLDFRNDFGCLRWALRGGGGSVKSELITQLNWNVTHDKKNFSHMH
jgi:hypothetical protein